MTRFILTGIIAGILLGVAVYIIAHRQREPQIQITPASSDRPAFRLFAPCPLGRRNIPLLPDERRA